MHSSTLIRPFLGKWQHIQERITGPAGTGATIVRVLITPAAADCPKLMTAESALTASQALVPN